MDFPPIYFKDFSLDFTDSRKISPPTRDTDLPLSQDHKIITEYRLSLELFTKPWHNLRRHQQSGSWTRGDWKLFPGNRSFYASWIQGMRFGSGGVTFKTSPSLSNGAL